MACPEVGDTSAARVASDELVEVAYGLGTALLRAQAARATGAVLLAEGDAQSALIQLRKAFHEFHTLGVCYDAARTRLLIAEACQALGGQAHHQQRLLRGEQRRRQRVEGGAACSAAVAVSAMAVPAARRSRTSSGL
jgi:ATP/maltotriose-dependent transcriptional regulator MalT